MTYGHLPQKQKHIMFIFLQVILHRRSEQTKPYNTGQYVSDTNMLSSTPQTFYTFYIYILNKFHRHVYNARYHHYCQLWKEQGLINMPVTNSKLWDTLCAANTGSLKRQLSQSQDTNKTSRLLCWHKVVVSLMYHPTDMPWLLNLSSHTPVETDRKTDVAPLHWFIFSLWLFILPAGIRILYDSTF